jgi:ABC-2 type transport system ATP-binding protein
MGYVLKTFDLTKKFKHKAAVDGANMTVYEGDIYGFVGENGSGKTTLIRLICGLIHPDGGSFELFGVSSADKKITEARRKTGAIVESPSIFRNMSAAENLRQQCILLGIEPNAEIIESTLASVGLGALVGEKKAAGDFSLGMRQRLGIAMALLGSPKLILLDEPMNGLDPVGIVEVRELILRLNRERGITFIISSHILTELSLVANRYGIISGGRIIKEISAEDLHDMFGKITTLKATDSEGAYKIATTCVPEENVRLDGDCIRISGEVDLNALFSRIIDSGNRILEVNCSETSFEEYYLSISGGRNNAKSAQS